MDWGTTWYKEGYTSTAGPNPYNPDQTTMQGEERRFAAREWYQGYMRARMDMKGLEETPTPDVEETVQEEADRLTDCIE